MLTLLIFAALSSFAQSEKTPCTIESSVDITNSEILSNNSIIHGGIEYLENQWYQDETEENNLTSVVRRGCICLIKDCLFKCCPEGQAHLGRPCGVSSDPAVNPFNPPVYMGSTLLEDVAAKDHFLFLYGNPCPNSDRYALYPNSQADRFYIQKDGALYQPSLAVGKQYHPEAWFCIDFFQLDPRDENASWTPQLVPVVCFSEETETPVVAALYGVYAIGLLISVPFLVATLAVYAFVPELRNLHGMCLMAYVSGLIVSFCLLAYLQLNTDSISTSMVGCYCIAFIIFYCFMSSFFWLNVMCFDIWRTFSRYGGKSINPARERRRFAWYGVYAWGMALALTAVTALMQFSENIPDFHIRPNFGTNKCWFADRGGELVYFYVPIFALVVVNSTLFAVTAHSIARIRRDTAILRSSESARTDQYERDKQRYALYLKLFVVMGVNWTLEVVSFFVKGSDWVWVVADLTNCALGIFIFIIFVWKNKVRNLLVKRYRRLRYGTSARTPSCRTSSNWTHSTHTDDRLHSDDGQQLRVAKQTQ